MTDLLLNIASTSVYLFGIFLLALLVMVAEVGFQLGIWRRNRRKEAEDPSIGMATTGMLGLLAFTLGLTISIAQGRYEARRDLVVQEANAIGTAWLRAQVAGGTEGPAMQRLLEQYTQVRIDFTVAHDEPARIANLVAETNRLQTEVWAQAQTVARREPTALSNGLLASLNEVIDLSLSQRFAFESRVPTHMMWLLLGGSLLAVGAMGYHVGLLGQRHRVLTVLLMLMWTGGMLLVMDLNRARQGNIRVDAAPLVWTLQGFGVTPRP